MEEKTQIGKIKAPLFLIGLTLLLVNDFYLKYAFGNGFTGKLSDVAGLFIFPYFFASLLPRHTKLIYWLTAGLFFYWKIPASQPLIDFLNGLGIGVNRTVDYSDVLTLFILPFSFRYFKSKEYTVRNYRQPEIALVGMISIFSFVATTVPHQEINVKSKLNKSFVVNLSKEELFSRMVSIGSYNDSLNKNLNDSLFYLFYNIPDYKARINVLSTISEIANNKIRIQLDSLIYCDIEGDITGVDEDDIETLNKFTPQDFENYFEECFIKKIGKDKEGSRLSFINKSAEENYYFEREKRLRELPVY